MKHTILYFIIVLLVACYGRDPEKTRHKGSKLPSFTLLLSDSTTYFNTNAIPLGHPVVLLYFGPHCPYSRAQIEEIIEDMALLKNIKFYIFTTSTYQELKKFIEHYKLNNYTNIISGIDNTHFFANYFEAKGVPYMAIYGKDKRLNESFIGKIYSSQIKEVAEE